MSAHASAAPPAVPADVAAFAAEQGVADCLAPMLELTRSVYPDAPIEVRVEEDAEEPELRFIAFFVDVVGWTADALFAAHQQWSAGLFRYCPTTHVHLFVVLLWASA
jgi:hypothetical protein